MENENQTSLTLSEKSQNDLLETAKWMKYLVVFTIVSIVLSLIINFFPYKIPNRPSQNPLYSIVGLIVDAVLYIFPIYCLLQFSKFIKRGVESKQANDFEVAFEQHRLNFKYWGIAIICLICLGFLFFIGLMTVGIIAASHAIQVQQ